MCFLFFFKCADMRIQILGNGSGEEYFRNFSYSFSNGLRLLLFIFVFHCKAGGAGSVTIIYAYNGIDKSSSNSPLVCCVHFRNSTIHSTSSCGFLTHSWREMGNH